MAVKEQLKRQAYEDFLKEKAMVDQARNGHTRSFPPGIRTPFHSPRAHPLHTRPFPPPRAPEFDMPLSEGTGDG
jgi:hypothetical protein